MGVAPYFGAQVDRWKWAVGLDPDVMIDVSVEGGYEGNGVGLKIGNAGE